MTSDAPATKENSETEQEHASDRPTAAQPKHRRKGNRRWRSGRDRFAAQKLHVSLAEHEPQPPVAQRYQFDPVGVETWRMIGGRTTIMTTTKHLASAHGMEPRHGKAAMLTYLRTLAQRGIMMLALPHGEPGAADKKRHHTS